jgi:hypothetical protein
MQVILFLYLKAVWVTLFLTKWSSGVSITYQKMQEKEM